MMKKVFKNLVAVGLVTGLSISSSLIVFGGDNTGWRQTATGWYYQDESGFIQNQWKEINGAWYYFNQDGYMLTGWQNLGGAWYYLNSSGVMHTGWLQLGNDWYYMDEHGVMVTGDRRITGKEYYFNADGKFSGDEQIDYVGRYVDGFTLGHGSDRGKRIEIEKISDGRIWASVYYHDYGSSADTIKGRLDGVKLENGVASGTYKRAWGELSDANGNELKTIYDTGSFQIKLKNSGEYTYETFNGGTEWEANAFSPISFRYGNGEFEDFYFFEDEWDGEIASWFMESEGDLF